MSEESTPRTARNLIRDEIESIRRMLRKLSTQVKVYGAIVTLGAVAIPAYGQIKAAYAEAQITKIVQTQCEPIATRAATKALEAWAKKGAFE